MPTCCEPGCDRYSGQKHGRCWKHALQRQRERNKIHSRKYRQSEAGKLVHDAACRSWKARNLEKFRGYQRRYEVTKRSLIRPPAIVRAPLMQYPFVKIIDARSADLLEVYRLIPSGFPDRDDVCQEIMLAIFEGRVTLEQVKASPSSMVRPFMRQHRAANYEARGHAVSLSQPRNGRPWSDLI